MEYTYEIIKDELSKSELLLRSDGAWIPMDESNSDYQRYLNSEAEQSTPSLTDETSTK
jgi:hypothetical protein